jgi:ribosomal protein S18 acetylase RimI-like enzyme
VRRARTLGGVETVTLRALSEADAPALTRLFAGIEAVDETGEHFDEDDIADELADASVDLDRDTLTAVGADGSLLGWTVVRSSPNVTDVDRVWLEGGVLPSRRGDGLGRRLLEWAERRGSELHRSRHPDLPGQLFVRVPATVPSQQALVRAAGYEPIRYWYGMKRDLSAPLPPIPAVPAGLRVVPWSAELDEPLRRAHGEAFADHWGSTAPDEQRWAQWYTGSRGFQPELSRLVLDGDRIVAYLLSYFYAADASATGVREAYIGQLGTLRPWRRRGLGGLLLATGLAAAHAGGYAQATLTVDSGNPTGALGLYERAGFVVDHEAVTWAKPVG